MQIKKYVKAINRIYNSVDASCNKFTSLTGIHCPPNCAQCCHGQNIYASPIEFLPFAYHLYTSGILENKYFEYKENTQLKCVLVEGSQKDSPGKCSYYQYRGLICRLFGNSSMIDKSGTKKFSSCAIIKEQAALVENFDKILQQKSPVYSDYYMQLRAIDNTYGGMLLPVNMAIIKSLEIVYYNTRSYSRPAV